VICRRRGEHSDRANEPNWFRTSPPHGRERDRDATGLGDVGAKLQAGTAMNLKRYANHSLAPKDWAGAKRKIPY